MMTDGVTGLAKMKSVIGHHTLVPWYDAIVVSVIRASYTVGVVLGFSDIGHWDITYSCCGIGL